MQRRNRGQRGSALVFLLASMTVAAVVVSTLVNRQSGASSVAAARELDAIADALALSGFELLSGIAEAPSSDQGAGFLEDRERDFAGACEFSKLFGLPNDATARAYPPPVAYPPLDDVAMEQDPRNNPPAVQDNDIRLPLLDPTLFPAGTTTEVPGTVPAAILPAASFRPLEGDNDHSGRGTHAHSTWRVIKALESNGAEVNPALAWWGPKNKGGTDLPEPALFQGGAASQKLPPPSLLVVRDVLAAHGVTLRGYIFCWYVKSAAGAKENLYITGARLRRLYNPGGVEQLGPEEMVSFTQVR